MALPTKSDVARFLNNKICSSIDLKDYFYSIRLSDYSSGFCNFYFKDKIYQVLRSTQGLSSSPYFSNIAMKLTLCDFVFQEWLGKMKSEFPATLNFPYKSPNEFVLAYVDDLSIGSDQDGGLILHTFCIHFVLYALDRANLRINAKKCEFFSRYIIFLGELYDTKLNISTIPIIKAKHFLSWRRPTSQAETCARIGSLSFFRHYLPHFTAVALPLLIMTKSPCFYWGPSQEKSWNELRLLVALQVEVSLQNPNMPLILVSDASNVQLAFSLYELGPGFHLKLIYSDSRVLTPAKANLSSVYREYLSLEFALYKTESYIRQCIPGTIIMSDANSIAFLQYAKSVKPQVQSFVNYMSSFSNIYYSYLPGKFLGL